VNPNSPPPVVWLSPVSLLTSIYRSRHSLARLLEEYHPFLPRLQSPALLLYLCFFIIPLSSLATGQRTASLRRFVSPPFRTLSYQLDWPVLNLYRCLDFVPVLTSPADFSCCYIPLVSYPFSSSFPRCMLSTAALALLLTFPVCSLHTIRYHFVVCTICSRLGLMCQS